MSCPCVLRCPCIAFQFGREGSADPFRVVIPVTVRGREIFTPDLECEYSRQVEILPTERGAETSDEIRSCITHFLTGCQ